MSSKVQIANLALVKLGAATITSFTDGSREANLVNTLYDDVAREVMSEGSWTACVTRAELNKLTTTPNWGFDSEFQLPTLPSVLKVLSINETTAGQYDYRIEGSKLLINTSAVKIEYIGEVTNSQSYGEYLKRSIVDRLMADLAYPITGSASLADRLEQRYQRNLRMNLANDGQQGAGIRVVSSNLIDVRGDSPDVID